MDVNQHLGTIWRRKWRILIVAAAVGGLVYWYTTTLAKTYSSQALLSVTPASASAGQTGAQEDSVFLAATYARLATTEPVVSDAVRLSKLAISADEGRGRISAAASGSLGFLSVGATGPTPTSATLLASSEATALGNAVNRQQQEALAGDLARLAPQLEAAAAQLRQLGPNDPQRASAEAEYTALLQERTQRELQPLNKVRVVQDAILPTKPTSPRPRRNAVLAFLAMLVVNAELWVLLEVLSGRFRQEDIIGDSHEATGLPILAEIPRGGGPETVEAFRALRTNLMLLDGEGEVRTIAVVGVEIGSGKSHVAIGLATAAADLEPALLIDGDLRRPVIHDRLRLSPVPGLTDLQSPKELTRTTQTLPDEPSLRVLTSGSHVSDPAAILAVRLRQILNGAGPSVKLVVVDTPASGYFADASAIATCCDATLLVIDPRTTRRRAVLRLIEDLRRVHANPIGIVLNRVPRTSGRSYYGRR